jgi:ureidoglycolate lyase
MRVVPIEPITRARYASYGHVVAPEGPCVSANQGTAKRYDRACEVANLRPHAYLNVAFFRCQPRASGTFALEMLEKHPHSEQLFVPMNASRFVVVVAQGGDAPDPETMRAFLVDGRTAVSYLPGVWHHPILGLDHETDFTVLVWEDGSAEDCVEAPLPPGLSVELPAPGRSAAVRDVGRRDLVTVGALAALGGGLWLFLAGAFDLFPFEQPQRRGPRHPAPDGPRDAAHASPDAGHAGPDAA